MTDTLKEIIKKDPFLQNINDKMQLLKDTICKGITDNEVELFKYQCQKLGLDPFAKQIYPVKRWNAALNRESMTIQMGIDGYRLIAERTGKYAPGKEPEFTYDKDGRLLCAKSYVKKQTRDGMWHEVVASAHYSEYAGLLKNGKPNNMWSTKPHIMLSKCAEALALRKAFPAELSGVYTKEEMDQADNDSIHVQKPQQNFDKPKEEEKPKELCTQEEYDGFIEAWAATYDRNILISYIERRAVYYKVDKKEIVAFLIKNQQNFEKEFLTWQSQNGNAVEKPKESTKESPSVFSVA